MPGYRKKLIEVALPLEAINKASAREKSIRHGHPSTLHLWWARRPLAACRAVIFTSLIDDPGEENVPQELLRLIDQLPAPHPLPPDWGDQPPADQRRERLFEFIARLVTWESTTDEEVIGTARELILAATEGNPPPILDPFCGGGSIPLEAQRLGLETYASDLNPVAVLITKALVEIPPKFAGMPPVNPVDRAGGTGGEAEWKGAAGLAADVRYYGNWMREEAWKRIGHLYPKGPNGETVIAWLWARTVKCPNPACSEATPLARSFQLSSKQNNQAWISATADADAGAVSFDIATRSPSLDGTVGRQGARCLFCDSEIPLSHIRAEGQRIGLGSQLTAVVEKGARRRIYRPPTQRDENAATVPIPDAVPISSLPDKALGFRVQNYGMTKWSSLFRARPLTALGEFSNLLSEARQQVYEQAIGTSVNAATYADAVCTYLAFGLSKLANRSSVLSFWNKGRENVEQVFARQALAMVWDSAEANPFSGSTGSWDSGIDNIARVVERANFAGGGGGGGGGRYIKRRRLTRFRRDLRAAS